MDRGTCIGKKNFDEYNAEEGKCKVEGDDGTVCVCSTDLCNDGKDDEESGVTRFVPQFMMILFISFSTYYFTSIETII